MFVPGTEEADSVLWGYQHGITTGVDEVHFAPPATSQFQDIPTNHQFYKKIAWLASQNITKTTNTTYSHQMVPGLISQMALFLRRLAKSTSGANSCGFQDVENINDSETRNAICWVKDKGINYARRRLCSHSLRTNGESATRQHANVSQARVDNGFVVAEIFVVYSTQFCAQ